jgi:hypothetical protein
VDVFLLVEYRRLSLMSDLTLRPTGGDGGIGGLGDVTVIVTVAILLLFGGTKSSDVCK